MKHKKQIFTTVLSVLISVFLVTGVVYAVTTISGTTITLNNMTTGIDFTGTHTKGIVMGTTGGSGSTTALGTLAASWYGIEMSVSANLAGNEAHAIRAEVETTAGTAGNIMVARFDAVPSHSVNTLQAVNATVQIMDDATLGGRTTAGLFSLWSNSGADLTKSNNDISALYVQHQLQDDPGTFADGFFNSGIQLSIIGNSWAEYGLVMNLQTSRMLAGMLVQVVGDNSFTLPIGILFKDTTAGSVRGVVTQGIVFDPSMLFTKGIVMGSTGGSGTTIGLGTLAASWYGIEIDVEANLAGNEAHAIRAEIETTAGTPGNIMVARFDAVPSHSVNTLQAVNATVQIEGNATLGGRTAAGLFSLYSTSGSDLTKSDNDISALFVQHWLQDDPGALSAGWFNSGIQVSLIGGTYAEYGMVFNVITSQMTAGILVNMSDSASVPAGILFDNKITTSGDGTVVNAISFGDRVTVTNVLDFAETDGSTGADISATIDTTGTAADAAIKIDIGGATYFIPAWTAANTTGSW